MLSFVFFFDMGSACKQRVLILLSFHSMHESGADAHQTGMAVEAARVEVTG